MFRNGVCCICFILEDFLYVCLHDRVRNILLTDKCMWFEGEKGES